MLGTLKWTNVDSTVVAYSVYYLKYTATEVSYALLASDIKTTSYDIPDLPLQNTVFAVRGYRANGEYSDISESDSVYLAVEKMPLITASVSSLSKDEAGVMVPTTITFSTTIVTGIHKWVVNGVVKTHTGYSLTINTFDNDLSVDVYVTNGANARVTDTIVIPYTQSSGLAFMSNVFKRSQAQPLLPVGGTFSTPIPTGWSDGIPANDANNYPIWMSTRKFTSDGQASTWSTPTQLTSNTTTKYEYSVDNISWHTVATVDDVYLKTTTNTDGVSTTNVMKIKGESGQGKVKGFSFTRHTSPPAAPDPAQGSFANPNATNTVGGVTWYDGPPSGTAPLYMTTRLFTSDAVGEDPVWSTPVEIGKDGLTGKGARFVFSTTETGTFTTSSEGAIWMKPQTSSDNVNWIDGVAVKIQGEKGTSGQGKVMGVSFKRSAIVLTTAPSGGTFTAPTATDWSDGVPSGTDQLYMSSKLFTSDAVGEGAWSIPAAISKDGVTGTGMQLQFSADSSSWHEAPATTDLYMRSGVSTAGGPYVYGGSVKIKGEAGSSTAIQIIYSSSTNAPNLPAANATTGWNTYSDNSTVWMSQQVNTVNSAGAVLSYGSWSTAVKVKGENGTSPSQLYTFIMYSANSAPTSAVDWSTTPNTYIGIAANQTSMPAWNSSAWAWSKFKGDNGSPLYTWIVYSSYANGYNGGTASISLSSDIYSMYIGILANSSSSSAPSTPSSYVWSKFKGADSTVSGDSAVRIYAVVDVSAADISIPTNGTLAIPTTPSGVTWASAPQLVSINQKQYQCDGIKRTSDSYITWGNPYLSLFKVDTLSAFTVKTGSLVSSTSGGMARLSINEQNSSQFAVYSDSNYLNCGIGDGYGILNSKFRGVWNGSSSYVSGDYVSFGAEIYKALTTVTPGISLSTDTYWASATYLNVGGRVMRRVIDVDVSAFTGLGTASLAYVGLGATMPTNADLVAITAKSTSATFSAIKSASSAYTTDTVHLHKKTFSSTKAVSFDLVSVSGTFGYESQYPTYSYGCNLIKTIYSSSTTSSSYSTRVTAATNEVGLDVSYYDDSTGYPITSVILCSNTYAMKATGSISVSGNITAYDGSDRRIKENIFPIADALAKVGSLSGNTFKWTKDYYDKQDKELFKEYDIGVIAQEVQEVLPQAVHERSDGVLAVNYVKLIPLLIEAIKEQQIQIEELRNGLASLSK